MNALAPFEEHITFIDTMFDLLESVDCNTEPLNNEDDGTTPGLFELTPLGTGHYRGIYTARGVIEEIAKADGLRIASIDAATAGPVVGHNAPNGSVTPDEIETYLNDQEYKYDLTVVWGSPQPRVDMGMRLYFWDNQSADDHDIDVDYRANFVTNNHPTRITFQNWNLPTISVHERVESDGSTDGERYAVLAAAPKILYIPFSLVELDYTHQKLQFAEIFSKGVKLATNDTIFEDWDTLRYEATIDSMIDAVKNVHRGQLSQLQRQARDSMQRLQAARNDVDNYQRQIDQIRPQIEAIRRASVPKQMLDPDFLRNVVLEIINLPDIETVRPGIDEYHLTAVTKLIDMTVEMDDGMEFTTEAGRFTLHLDFNTPRISIENEARYSMGSYQHPHVSSGDFCLGASRELVYSLMRDLEFKTAIEVLVDQLKTVNPDDCYTSEWMEFFGDQLQDYMHYDEDPDEY